jgi:hypothetical protein
MRVNAPYKVVQAPFHAPNANAYAERFARSIKHERLAWFRSASATYAAHSGTSSITTIVSGITKDSRIG